MNLEGYSLPKSVRRLYGLNGIKSLKDLAAVMDVMHLRIPNMFVAQQIACCKENRMRTEGLATIFLAVFVHRLTEQEISDVSTTFH